MQILPLTLMTLMWPPDLLKCFSVYSYETWHIEITLHADFIFDLKLNLLTLFNVLQITTMKLDPLGCFFKLISIFCYSLHIEISSVHSSQQTHGPEVTQVSGSGPSWPSCYYFDAWFISFTKQDSFHCIALETNHTLFPTCTWWKRCK